MLVFEIEDDKRESLIFKFLDDKGLIPKPRTQNSHKGEDFQYYCLLLQPSGKHIIGCVCDQ